MANTKPHTKPATARKGAAKPTITPVAAPAPTVAPVAAPTPVVALRGGLEVAAVAATGKPYRTAAAHNAAWWAAIGAALATGNGTAGVAALCAQAPAGPGVPAHFVGYCVRRGYLAAATAPAQA